MKRLSPENVEGYKKRPERIVQFGEGNFLRGFIDWMVHQMNQKGLFNGSVVAIQPTPHGKVLPKFEKQDYIYTLVLRGIDSHQTIDISEVITSISRGINPYSDWNDVLDLAKNNEIQFIFSNTTEAGLTYYKEDYCQGESPLSYPGKLTVLLFERYKHSKGDSASGFHIFPCELVENNGDVLRELVLNVSRDFGFPEDFRRWVSECNAFYNTLVDRIVTGFPKAHLDEFYNRLGYVDELLTVGEPYHLFVIDGPESMEEHLPFRKAGLNVLWANEEPYRELKVKILNGLHTLIYAIGLLEGEETVLEVMKNESLRGVVEGCLKQEILPTIHMKHKEKTAFAEAVIQRFLNPYNRHLLTDLGLNGLTKFKVRLIPTLIDYIKENHEVPEMLSFSLATNLLFYRPDHEIDGTIFSKAGHKSYALKESKEVLEMMAQAWEYESPDRNDLTIDQIKEVVKNVLGNQKLWGQDLSQSLDLVEKVAQNLKSILELGIKEALKAKKLIE